MQEQKRAQDADRGVYGKDAQAPEGQEYQAPKVSGWQKFKNNMQDRMEDLVDNLSMLKDDVRNKINDMVQAVTRPLKSFAKTVGEKASDVAALIAEKSRDAKQYRENKRQTKLRESKDMQGIDALLMDTKTAARHQVQDRTRPKNFGKVTNRGPAPRAAGAGRSAGRGGRG